MSKDNNLVDFKSGHWNSVDWNSGCLNTPELPNFDNDIFKEIRLTEET